MTEPSSGVTALLKKVAGGDAAVQDELFRRVETELRKIAQKRMLGERTDHTLQPTVLVDEAFLRVLRGDHKTEWRDRRELPIKSRSGVICDRFAASLQSFPLCGIHSAVGARLPGATPSQTRGLRRIARRPDRSSSYKA